MVAEFKIGDSVQDTRKRKKKGRITDPPRMKGGRMMARVEWDDGSASWLPLRLLDHASQERSVSALLADRAFGGHDDFVRNYTHRKLLTPVDDTLYSLIASRTQLLPHQFKPLVRFLESVHRRFLIADEVGLGKTIEAGIIISELRARRNLGGVLVICPNHLRDKWHAELMTRFEEEFEVCAKRKAWMDLCDQYQDESTEGLRVIVGQKTLGARKLLAQAEQGVPTFDLIIVDEAHYARNTATLFRRILGELADAANQLLLLTATPLQTQVENLLSLLRLIDEPAFRNKELFGRRLQTNRTLVRAEGIIRKSSKDSASVAESATAAEEELGELDSGQISAFGLDRENRLVRVRGKLQVLQSMEEPTISDLSPIAEDLRNLNLLAPYITRTRKTEVQRTCERRVEAVRPELTADEQAFYSDTVRWIKERIRERHGEESVTFLSREPERRLASSFHGFWRHLVGRAQAEDTLLGEPPPHLFRAYQAIRRTDTKYAKLRSALRRLEDADPKAKVLVFASFRASIAYLSHRFSRDGIQHEWIHGGIHMDPTDEEKNERGRRIRRFLTDPETRVLISSNVGGEGLDLQAASVVVNYDLPWNPAVVEQRIGRVDRFGQERDAIQVLNIILPDTVEDLIFTRLMDRLHLFQETIGDLAQVLGPLVRQLSTDFLHQDLSPEEIQRRLDDSVWRGENNLKHRQELLKREGEFIAFDEEFSNHLKGLEDSGQTMRPDEIAGVCVGVVEQHFPASILREYEFEANGEPIRGVFELVLDYHLREELVKALRQSGSSVLRRFVAKFPEGKPRLVTFDGRVAEANPLLVLLTTRHPFVRALVRFNEDGDLFHPVSAVVLQGSAAANTTSGLLTLSEAELQFGVQLRRYLLPVFVTQDGSKPVEEGRKILRRTLDRGKASTGAEAPKSETLVKMLQEGSRAAEDHLDSLANRLLDIEQSRIRPRVAEAEARYDRRIANTRERLWEAKHQTEPDEKRIKGIEKYLRSLFREKKRKLEELSRTPELEQRIKPVGASWITVT